MSLDFGKKIAALRKMHGVTQAQLADYLMVQPQTVSRWESEGGTPDVTLLPKIATFFNVSIDELFGMTDMEQIDNLVYKYSVLRDEKSFEEVMRRIELALGSLEKEKSVDMREQLLAWKVHIYIQKSRQAQEEAEKILDELIKNTDENSKLTLSLKLQKNQFLIQKGEGRTVLKETRAAWEKEQTIENLHCYMAALMESDRAGEIMDLWESNEVRILVENVNEETIPLWQMMFWSAAVEEEICYFKKWMNKFREEADEHAAFELDWTWTGLLKKLGHEKEKEESKKKLLEKVENLPLNEYLKMNYIKRIHEL